MHDNWLNFTWDQGSNAVTVSKPSGETPMTQPYKLPLRVELLATNGRIDVVVSDDPGNFSQWTCYGSCGEDSLMVDHATALVRAANREAAAEKLAEAVFKTLMRHVNGGFHESRDDFDECKTLLTNALAEWEAVK
jgi:hypothetical protein